MFFYLSIAVLCEKLKVALFTHPLHSWAIINTIMGSVLQDPNTDEFCSMEHDELMLEARNGLPVIQKAVRHNCIHAISIAMEYEEIDYHKMCVYVIHFNKNTKIIKLLLDAGKVRIDSVDADGLTLFHRAVWWGRISSIDELINFDKNCVNAVTSRGITALHYAAYGCHISIIERLLLNGNIDICARNDRGSTPLHFAVDCQRQSIVEFIIWLDSRVLDVLDNMGRSPLLCALISSIHPLLALLISLISPEEYAQLHVPQCHRRIVISEDERYETRFRVFFSRPLVYRLLLCLKY
jgi:hypothetical protein